MARSGFLVSGENRMPQCQPALPGGQHLCGLLHCSRAWLVRKTSPNTQPLLLWVRVGAGHGTRARFPLGSMEDRPPGSRRPEPITPETTGSGNTHKMSRDRRGFQVIPEKPLFPASVYREVRSARCNDY